MTRSALHGASLACLLLTLAAPATSAKYRRPFGPQLGVKYGFDHDGSKTNGVCQSFDCGGLCYDGHKGSDFPVPLGTEVVAAADGAVTTVVQGCPDVGSLGSTCGGGFGNYVKLTHEDGRTTYYGHMKDGSIVVAAGGTVKCGQKLGLSATSGSSTGPHLHFEPRDGGTTSVDPFAGGCSQPASLWVQQSGTLPGDQCEVPCACTAGQTQDQACGQCGVQHRTCNGACQWDAWGACTNEGPCMSGAKQESDCACMGKQTRLCDPTCQWGPASACPPCPEAGVGGQSGSAGSAGAGGAGASGKAGAGGQLAQGGASGHAASAGSAATPKAGAAGAGQAGSTGKAGASGKTVVAFSAPQATEEGACSCEVPGARSADPAWALLVSLLLLRRRSPRS